MANQEMVPASAFTKGTAERRKSATSFSLPGFASNGTYSANFDIIFLLLDVCVRFHSSLGAGEFCGSRTRCRRPGIMLQLAYVLSVLPGSGPPDRLPFAMRREPASMNF